MSVAGENSLRAPVTPKIAGSGNGGGFDDVERMRREFEAKIIELQTIVRALVVKAGGV